MINLSTGGPLYSTVFFLLILPIVKYVKAYPTYSQAAVEKLGTILINGDTNAVVSPFSIYSALLPLKLGAGGDTKAELDFLLTEFELQQEEFRNAQKLSQDFSSTTAVFSSSTIKLLPEYRESLATAHVQSVENFDFQKYELVNDFVKNATNGSIKDLVGPTTFHNETELVIINGVHFDAPWKNPFQSTYRSIPFTLNDGKIQDIPMMYQKSSNYVSKSKELDATIIEIPYKSLTKVLRVYLPSTHNGLPFLLRKLETFNTSTLAFKLGEIEVTLPKFKIDSQFQVTKGLDKLGLKSLASSKANLSRISSTLLRVDEIICKSLIDVGESGTKAGSATGIFLIPLSGFLSDEFTANRPFYFEIRDPKVGTVYFAGIFTKPDPPPPSPQPPVFVTRLNQPRSKPKPVQKPPTVEPEEDVGSSKEEIPWWIHNGKPEYLLSSPADLDSITPRFQQPEPIYPSGIRFPIKDLNTRHIIDTHIRNSSLNSVS